MKEKLEAISKMSKEKIAEIKDSQALNDFKVKVLGKKGELTEILRGMKDIAAEERPVVGNLVNKIRDEIHKKIMKALIQVYGEEEANKINEEWIGCSSEIEIENEIVIFKEALYLGYDLADVFFNRR